MTGQELRTRYPFCLLDENDLDHLIRYTRIKKRDPQFSLDRLAAEISAEQVAIKAKKELVA